MTSALAIESFAAPDVTVGVGVTSDAQPCWQMSGVEVARGEDAGGWVLVSGSGAPAVSVGSSAEVVAVPRIVTANATSMVRVKSAKTAPSRESDSGVKQQPHVSACCYASILAGTPERPFYARQMYDVNRR